MGSFNCRTSMRTQLILYTLLFGCYLEVQGATKSYLIETSKASKDLERRIGEALAQELRRRSEAAESDGGDYFGPEILGIVSAALPGIASALGSVGTQIGVPELGPNSTSTVILIVHKLLSMFAFFIRVLAEIFGKTRICNIITGEIKFHGHVYVTCMELHIDLLVDKGLTIFMIILPNS